MKLEYPYERDVYLPDYDDDTYYYDNKIYYPDKDFRLGKTVKIRAQPTYDFRDGSKWVLYDFIRWDNVPDSDPDKYNPTRNFLGTYEVRDTAPCYVVDVYPIFGTLPKYTVNFYDDDMATLLKTVEVKERQEGTPPSDPAKTGYTFDGWDVHNSWQTVLAPVDVYATYLENFTVMFYDYNGTLLHTRECPIALT